MAGESTILGTSGHLSLRLDTGRLIALVPGARLRVCDVVGFAPGVSDRLAIAVAQHPKDPAAVRLTNLGQQTWRLTNLRGDRAQLKPGNVMTVHHGTRVEFGDFTGTLEWIAAVGQGSIPVGVQVAPSPVAVASPSGPSFWWIIIPTAFYALASVHLPRTIVLIVLGIALRIIQTRMWLPQSLKAFVPLLQSFVVFMFLGVDPVLVAGVAVVTAIVFLQANRVVALLNPWWRVQGLISPSLRRLMAIALTLLVGYHFGTIAAGHEWTYTFESIVIGTVITFLLVFTPPDRLRRTNARRPA